jgi:hypothetical protein
MKKIHTLACASLFFLSYIMEESLNAQTVFQKYVSDIIEYQKIMASPADSSYILAGSTRNSAGVYDLCAAKINRQGAVMWSTIYSSDNEDFLYSVSVAKNGDIVMGASCPNSEGHYDFAILKIDPSGKLLWNKLYATQGSDMLQYIKQTENGEIVAVGNSRMTNIPWVLKLSSDGNIIWSKMYGHNLTGSEVKGLGATYTTDGGILLFGEYKGQNFISKINSDGSTAWAKVHTVASYINYPSVLYPVSDGGLLVSGKQQDCSNGTCTVRFATVKINKDGTFGWMNSIQKYSGEVRNVLENKDQSYTFIGQLTDSLSKLVLIQTDISGKIKWAKSYGNYDSYGEYAWMEATPDNGFIFMGVERSNALLIKTDQQGNATCGVKDLLLTTSSISIPSSNNLILPTLKDSITISTIPYKVMPITLTVSNACALTSALEKNSLPAVQIMPNPCKENFTVHVPAEGRFDNATFELYDTFGRRMMLQPVHSGNFTIATQQLSKGIYFCSIRSSNGYTLHAQKVVVE